MPTYNREHYLPIAVQSVLDQSFTDFELFIVDDCSTDGTESVAKAITDPRVRYVRQSQNLGWLGNCNSALQHVRSEYATILGDDDVMAPGYLEQAIAAMDATPDVGLVHSAFDIVDAHGRVVQRKVDYTRTATRTQVESGEDFIRLSMRYGCRVAAPTVVLRTSLLPEPPFDPDDGPAADLGCWLRIARQAKVLFIAQACVQYRVHAGSDSAKWSKQRGSRYVETRAAARKVHDMKLRFLAEFERELVEPAALRRSAQLAHATRLAASVVPEPVKDSLRFARDGWRRFRTSGLYRG